jgi:tetratricopeptide (TPR) repeat protein
MADDYLPPREAFPKAEAAARRALALDSSSPDAHAELGLVLRFYDWNYAAGERELQRAIGLNPNHARAHFYSGLALLSNGSRLDSALAVMRRAESLDPLNPGVVSNVGWALLFKGSYDEAVAQCRKALELDAPSSFALGYMGEALVLAGRPADALEVLQRAHDPPARIKADIARALLALGRRAEALKVLRAMERHVGQHYALPIASVYVALGDRDAMLRWLEKAYNARSSNMAYLATEPIWEPVRADPRFAEMMKRVGVP